MANKKVTIELTPEEYDTFQDAAEYTGQDIQTCIKGFAIAGAQAMFVGAVIEQDRMMQQPGLGDPQNPN